MKSNGVAIAELKDKGETQILKYYRVNFWIRQVGPIADMAHVGWSLVTRDYADVVGRDHLIFYP